MRGITIASLITIVCHALAAPDPNGGLIIQVMQEVHGSCGGGCRGRHEKKCYEGPHGLQLWVTKPGTYEDVRLQCEEKGYEFLAITNEFLWLYVIQTLRDEVGGVHDYWVDGSFNGTDWLYSDGTAMPLGSPYWDVQFDRPCENMDTCTSLQGGRGLYWLDAPCHYHKHGVCVCCKVPPPPVPPPVLTCPGSTFQLYDRCFLILPARENHHQDAVDACNNEGGHLLSIDNPGILREFYLYVEGISATQIIFVDGKVDSNGIYRFEDGAAVPMGSPYWQVGFPAVVTDYIFYHTRVGLVNDLPPNTSPPYDVACEFPPV